jgi:hypothetical protein
MTAVNVKKATAETTTEARERAREKERTEAVDSTIARF